MIMGDQCLFKIQHLLEFLTVDQLLKRAMLLSLALSIQVLTLKQIQQTIKSTESIEIGTITLKLNNTLNLDPAINTVLPTLIVLRLTYRITHLNTLDL